VRSLSASHWLTRPHLGTYGCSREMCGFRNELVGASSSSLLCYDCTLIISTSDGRAFSSSNVQLIGIGPNPVADIKKWTDKEKMNVRWLVRFAL
jgi:peroxiredoxin